MCSSDLVSPFVTAQSLGANFTSNPFYIGEFDHVGVQIVVTNASGLNGSLQLQRSVDGVSFDNFGSAQTLNANTVICVQIQDVYFGYIRANYTRTAGSGDVTIKLGTVVHR